MHPSRYDTTVRPLVYVAGPFNAPDRLGIERNKQRAREACAEVWLAGGVPICPHVQGEFVQGLIEEERILGGVIQQMERCDVVYAVLGLSPGTLAEIHRAGVLHIPVIRSREKLIQFVHYCLKGRTNAYRA